MSLIDHLSELRHRLVVSIAAICVGAIFGWFLFQPVIDLLTDPYCDYLKTVPPSQRVTQDCGLFFSGALEPLITKFKLVGFLGLFIALPVILYQAWAFIVPGLTKRERRMGSPSSCVPWRCSSWVRWSRTGPSRKRLASSSVSLARVSCRC